MQGGWGGVARCFLTEDQATRASRGRSSAVTQAGGRLGELARGCRGVRDGRLHPALHQDQEEPLQEDVAPRTVFVAAEWP